jgi:hypothetical protein
MEKRLVYSVVMKQRKCIAAEKRRWDFRKNCRRYPGNGTGGNHFQNLIKRCDNLNSERGGHTTERENSRRIILWYLSMN